MSADVLLPGGCGALRDLSPGESAALAYLGALPSASSRVPMRAALERIAAHLVGRSIDKWEEIPEAEWIAHELPWGELRREHTNALWEWMRETWEPATANRMLSALKGVLEHAWELGQMPADEYQRAVRLRSLKVDRDAAGRALSQGEILALADVCRLDESACGVRDGALLAVLTIAGLRRAEFVALDYSDWSPAEARLTIRDGKGGKARNAYVDAGTGEALERWVIHRGFHSGPLFCGLTPRGARPTGRRLTPDAVRKITVRRAREAGVESFSPHDLRRSCATSMLDAGVDLLLVQKQLGHASSDTTRRYDRRDDRALQKAVGKLHWPG